jgi:hypothetical protein
MVFASDAVRSTAVVVPTEGMISYLDTDAEFSYYDGGSWQPLVPEIGGGVAGQAYVSNGTASAAFGDMKANFISTDISEKTGSYTVAASDANTIIQTTGTANVTITVPDVLSVGDSVQVIRDGSGSAIISAGSGVSSWAGIGTASTAVSFYIDTQYSAAAILKIDANEYRVIGRISR